MIFNEDLNALSWAEIEKQETTNNPVMRMKKYLCEKYYNNIPYTEIFPGLWLSDLYRIEVNIEFSPIVKKRYERVMTWGYPKRCPINKFINQPTLF